MEYTTNNNKRRTKLKRKEIVMCKDCEKPDPIKGYYKDKYGKTMTIQQCTNCKCLTHNLAPKK